MKKTALALFSLAVMGLSGVANAATAYQVPGYVYVSANHISATMNIAHNPREFSTSSPYVSVYGYANSNVYVTGTDGSGNSFTCYVAPSSPLYQTAVDIRNSMDNGSHIYAYKTSTSSACSTIYMNHSSYLLN
jgi:hypothetical protein